MCVCACVCVCMCMCASVCVCACVRVCVCEIIDLTCNIGSQPSTGDVLYFEELCQLGRSDYFVDTDQTGKHIGSIYIYSCW